VHYVCHGATQTNVTSGNPEPRTERVNTNREAELRSVNDVVQCLEKITARLKVQLDDELHDSRIGVEVRDLAERRTVDVVVADKEVHSV
jgi:hypothetical protein